VTDTYLKRTTLVVEDGARSIAFYRDVLGLKVYYDKPASIGGKIIPAGGPAQTRLAIMEGNHPDVGKIGLMQWVDPQLPKPAAPRTRLGIGDIVFVTETPDMQNLHDRLKASPCCRIHCPPHDWSVPAPGGKGVIELTTMSFFDPDGFFFEVNHKRNAPNLAGFGVKRTTMIVRDAQKALDFYTGVMGLEVWYDQEMTIGGQVLPAGEPGAKVRVVILKCDDPDVGMLGLMAFLDPLLPDPGPPPHIIGIGQAIFVAGCEETHAIHERMRSSAARIHTPPSADSVVNAAGGTDHMTTMSFFDPDGFFFELNDRRPAKSR